MQSNNKALVQKVIALSAAGSFAALAYLVPIQEGTSYKAYRDPIGIPTICEGWTEGVKMGDTKTPQECADLIAPRLREELAYVQSTSKRPLPTTRAVALADFTYNVGRGTYAKSSVKRKLDAGDVIGGCNALTLYVYAGKTYLPGLASRREIEKELCLYEPVKSPPGK